MFYRQLIGFLSLTCGLGLPGCGPKSPPADPAPVAHSGPVLHLSSAPRIAPGDRADMLVAGNDIDVIMQLDVYPLVVPFGAVSHNAEFWRHVDEDHIDPVAHQLLDESGVRVGIAPDAEWAYFKDLVEKYNATTRKGSTTPVNRGLLELPMRMAVEEQDIFYLNSAGRLCGRSYHKCDNILSVAYAPCPRHPGDARIEVCAVVRGLRKQFEVTVLNEERDIQFKRPEYLYDLRLKQDVPIDHFLVLAPSAMAALPDSLGHAFFVHPGPAEPTETVLLLVPKPFRLGEVPAAPIAGPAVDTTIQTPPRDPKFLQMPKLRP